MSVRYLQGIKTQCGVYARWYEILGNYSFSVTHAKVVVEDAISRCPDACREPYQYELDLENDFEPDPVGLEYNLEKLAQTTREDPSYGIQDREEEIYELRNYEAEDILQEMKKTRTRRGRERNPLSMGHDSKRDLKP